MSTFICTFDALKQAAEISRAVRFRYARDAVTNTDISDAAENPDKPLNMGVSIVAEDARVGQSAIVILHQGTPIAYDNICPHRGTELDWNYGDVFDETGLYLICATHGALFVPETGLCVSGPCTKQSLRKLNLLHNDGNLYLA